MPDVSIKEFIASIKKSRVIEADRFKEWLEVSEAKTPKDLAKALVRDQLLTKWQAKYLMSGRSRLDIGSYRLLERTSRDELGDRFLAMHTSLARRVDLQVLPAEITKDNIRCKAFLKKASQVGKLDHQNLVHVYDIDQEGERYFLVTEYVEATPLDQYPRTKIKAKDVAAKIGEALVGIQYAHRNGVAHGGLTQADLLVVDDDCLKIQNLAVSPLRSSTETDATGDLAALRKIGIGLLKQIPESSRKEDYKKVGKILVNFKPEEPDSLDSTISELSKWITAPVIEAGVEMPAIDVLGVETGNKSEGGFDKPIEGAALAKRKKKPAKKEENGEASEEAVEAAEKTGLWNRNPVAVIATIAVASLIGLCGIGYGVYSGLTGDTVATNNGNANTNPVAKTDNSRAKTTPVKKADGPLSESDINAALKKFGKSDESDKGENGNKEEGKGKGKSSKENNKPRNNNGNNQNAENWKVRYPDTAMYGAPRLKRECNFGPGDNQVKVPAETAVVVIGQQSSEGWVEVKAKLADGTEVSDWINSKFIYDSAPEKAVAAKGPAKQNPGQAAKGSPAADKAVAKKTEPEKKKPSFQLTDISGIGPKTKTTLELGNLKTVEQLAKMSTTDVRAAFRKAGKQNENRLNVYKGWIEQAKLMLNDKTPIKKGDFAAPATVASKSGGAKPNPEGPFAGFPRITDLPKIDNLAEKKISNLVINQAYLLGLEIIAEPGISKTKLYFELTRDTEDKQKWLVGVKRTPKKKPTTLAHFRKSEDAFYFQWLPEAANNKYSEFLRNCKLKLKLPDDSSAYLTLRKPIKIHDLRLTRASLVNGLELDIPAMPHPDNIVVEVLPLRVSGLELDTVVSVVERGSPARIMLKRRDANGFMWIQVAGELKSDLKLQANLLCRVGNRILPITDFPGINSFLETVKQLENQAVRANQIKQQQQPQKNKKTELDKEKAQFQSNANKAKEATNKVIQYREIMSKVVDKPIHIRVYAKFGSLQTQLVVTDPKLPQPKKKKKK